MRTRRETQWMKSFCLRRLKALALGSAVAYLGAGIFLAVEPVLYPHVICLEHGELVHAEHRKDSPRLRHGASPGEVHQSLTASSTVEDDSHLSHEHCPNTGTRRSSKNAIAEHSGVETPVSVVSTIHENHALSMRSIPLYRLAPSHSPPNTPLSV